MSDAGRAGEVLADRIADRSWGTMRVAIVERELVGGQCPVSYPGTT